MDGIEWKRDQFGILGKLWYYANERIAAFFAGNRLIADHPEIQAHLETRVRASKIEMIPYGSDKITAGDLKVLKQFDVAEYNYGTVIARVEKDNSILEIVRAFSTRTRKCKLLVLGNLDENNSYHQEIIKSASDEVVFTGAIYEKETVQSLRYFSKFYVHGHKVGGTNPSLVEALGASNVIIAKKNIFNEWVAQDAAVYFSAEKDLDRLITLVLEDQELSKNLRLKAATRHADAFTWQRVLSQYQTLLEKFL